MSKITGLSVQAKHKDRCNLYIDGEFFLGLSIELAVKFNLKVGNEVSECELIELIQEGEKIDAMNKAVAYVTKSLKTKRQVKEYLQRKGFDENIIWQVIDKLKEYKYIDDVEYAKRYIESTSKASGQKLIDYKLMAKGVKKEDILNALDEAQVSYVDSATILAEKYMRNKEKTKENYYKVYKYLIGRGFSYEQADLATLKFKKGEDI